MELEDKIARAEVIDVSKLSGSVSQIRRHGYPRRRGDRRGADLPDRRRGRGRHPSGRLSVTSPLARALIGKGKGDSVEVSTPRGAKSYEVVTVAFGDPCSAAPGSVNRNHGGAVPRSAIRAERPDPLVWVSA